MKCFKFKKLLISEKKWASPGYVLVDDQGLVNKVGEGEPLTLDPNTAIEEIDGVGIPGMTNAHSHSFQYAMAGVAENLPEGRENDDFWSWRESMYKLALELDPDQFEVIATQLYTEMVKNGWTSVVEFHYIHHDKDGKPYNSLGEMGLRLMKASKASGIQLNLVPIFYQKGGLGLDPGPGQRRFISKNVDDYLDLLKDLEAKAKEFSHGVEVQPGLHSIRAVEESSLRRILKDFSDRPIHIHISEQMKEVEDSLSFYGQRPVEWLLSPLKEAKNLHLVHATHLDSKEVSLIASKGATVVLCPTTEGNLGDGIFPLREFLKSEGKFSIGTDSHVGLCPFEELRQLDYGQRLQAQKRNTVCLRGGEDSGEVLYLQSLKGGLEARGRNKDSLELYPKGKKFEAMVIWADHPQIVGRKNHQIFSSLIFSGGKDFLKGTIIGNQWANLNRKKESSEIESKWKDLMGGLDF